jgi:hypothetical protein
MAAMWFFLVFALGGHKGHSFVNGMVVDRVVLPTCEACEAARQGVLEHEAGHEGALYEVGPCEPVAREPRRDRSQSSD